MPVEACRGYTRALAREILPELRVARVMARLLYGRPGWRRAVFRRFGRPLCEAVADVISGRRSYRRLVFTPVNYLKLLAVALRG